jgi:tripartite-type tricarboxylate transporter receptor subunit TctC
MKFPRRAFLRLAAGAVALPAVSHIAKAQAYPSRPVTLIVFVPPGGVPDITARLIGQSLSQRLGQAVVIDNRSGAGGNLALQTVARAEADGYTLLLVGTPHAINTTLYEKLNVNVARDIAPVASINNGSFVMVVSPLMPAKTVPEFIVYAKANPGKINMASSGSGNLSHLSGELFRMMTGIEVVHVPYRGAPAAHSGLMAGDAHVMFDATGSALSQIHSGRLRALAVTSARRWEGLPDIPTVGDFVPGYAVSGWLGVGAPKGTRCHGQRTTCWLAGRLRQAHRRRNREVGSPAPTITRPRRRGDRVIEGYNRGVNAALFDDARALRDNYELSRLGPSDTPPLSYPSIYLLSGKVS